MDENYHAEFKKFLVYATGSLEETKVWLSFAKDCQYITDEQFQKGNCITDEIGAKLYKQYMTWK